MDVELRSDAVLGFGLRLELRNRRSERPRRERLQLVVGVFRSGSKRCFAGLDGAGRECRGDQVPMVIGSGKFFVLYGLPKLSTRRRQVRARQNRCSNP